jgi:hypothetical protein
MKDKKAMIQDLMVFNPEFKEPDYKKLYEESEKLNFSLSANQCVANGLRVDENHDSVFCVYKEKSNQEAAWDMFRRLYKKYKHKFIEKLYNMHLKDTGYDLWDERFLLYLLDTKASAVIEILQEIEKELKDENICKNEK